jgi:short-subunit dehydrogenase
MFKRLLILGASRGLGRAVALHSPIHFENLKEICLVSRKVDQLGDVATEIKNTTFKGRVEIASLDLTTENHQIEACRMLRATEFDLVVYCAGGGPHGEFIKKDWKDHLWALQINQVAPARILHQWLKLRDQMPELAKFVVVGSRVAENKSDPLAASYSSGKSGLYGLINSLQPELENKPFKAWLFSPGYMDTEMLPSTAKVRHDGSKLMSADAAAQAMLRWIKKDEPWHRVLN